MSLATSDLIVKSGGSDYSGLAVNEFVCMSIARRAGIPVPEFFLSGNRQLFVMRRFDRTPDGRALGFEEMAVLMAKGAAQKYEGSYEQVALSCILGNGDAHLKNFGVLYDNPTSQDVWFSPTYDLVCTTAYIPDDSLALTLGGSKSLFASRVHLMDFARRCEIGSPRDRIHALLHAVEQGIDEHRTLLDEEPVVREGIRQAFEGFASRFNPG